MKKGIIAVVSTLAGITAGAGAVGKMTSEELRKQKGYAGKHLALYLMMNQWVKVKQEGKSLSAYFEKNGYKKIAVYGMSYAGETLINELENTGITVAYGIDKNANGIYSDVNLFSAEDDLEAVDAVVVTAITFFDEIEQNLSKKMDCPIISLEDILYEI